MLLDITRITVPQGQTVDGAIRSPDIAWIAKERVAKFSKEEKKKFLPLTPDFVLELMSPSDNLKDTQAKMNEYRDNGVKLGWLIDPLQQQVEIYRQDEAMKVVSQPSTLSGEELLPNLVVELDFIWQ